MLNSELNLTKRQKLTPMRLPEKLRQIRLHNDLTQIEMLHIVNPIESDVNRARISQYEKGVRSPSLVEVQNYADYAGIPIERLTNDNLDLPDSISVCGKKSNKNKGSAAKKYKKFKRKISFSQTEQQMNKSNADAKEQSGAAVKTKSSEETIVQVNAPDNKNGKTDAFSNAADSTHQKTEITFSADNHTNKSSTRLELKSCSIPVREETLRRCGEMYLELLRQTPCEKWAELSFDVFIENIFAVTFNDYAGRGAESAIACRLRLLTEKK